MNMRAMYLTRPRYLPGRALRTVTECFRLSSKLNNSMVTGLSIDHLRQMVHRIHAKQAVGPGGYGSRQSIGMRAVLLSYIPELIFRRPQILPVYQLYHYSEGISFYARHVLT